MVLPNFSTYSLYATVLLVAALVSGLFAYDTRAAKSTASAPSAPAESSTVITESLAAPLIAEERIAEQRVAEELVRADMTAEEMAAKKAMMAREPMAANADIRNHRACNTSGIALSGIDVVSYHKPTGPLMGNSEFTVSHEGLIYHFLSAAHAAEFSADKDRYLPKYLGWCATSLAVGALTCPNPLNYKLENGELLLFETTGFTNGQSLWNADPLGYRQRANQNRDTFLNMPGG